MVPTQELLFCPLEHASKFLKTPQNLGNLESRTHLPNPPTKQNRKGQPAVKSKKSIYGQWRGFGKCLTATEIFDHSPDSIKDIWLGR